MLPAGTLTADQRGEPVCGSSTSQPIVKCVEQEYKCKSVELDELQTTLNWLTASYCQDKIKLLEA